MCSSDLHLISTVKCGLLPIKIEFWVKNLDSYLSVLPSRFCSALTDFLFLAKVLLLRAMLALSWQSYLSGLNR